MWVEAEHAAAEQLRWCFGAERFHHADRGVAVFHRRGKIALLERTPHALALARGHAAPEHQALGAPADAARDRGDAHLAAAGLRNRRRADLAAARLRHPERP